ncbi:MAG: FecR family protein [Ignavibacteriales bacterium]
MSISDDATLTPLQSAAIWRMRRESADWSAEAEAAFQEWLAADELHRRAFERTGKVWDLVDSHAATPDVMVVRRDALHRAQRTARDRMMRWSRSGAITRRGGFAAAAGLLLAAGIGAWPLLHPGEVYETRRNERRVVTLKDGSRLSLDAMTKVTVDYSDEARRLTLVRGQARFDVAHDVSRPFSVRARDRTVVATGTAFNIDIYGDAARVTLIEGRVVILSAKDAAAGPLPKPGSTHLPPKAVELRPGQQLVAAVDEPAQIVPNVDLQQAVAWQQGKLMFDKEPLAEAAARMNRYSSRQIAIGDPAAGAIPISGAFDAGDMHGFLEAVTAYLPVTAVDGPEGVTLRSSTAQG